MSILEHEVWEFLLKLSVCEQNKDVRCLWGTYLDLSARTAAERRDLWKVVVDSNWITIERVNRWGLLYPTKAPCQA